MNFTKDHRVDMYHFRTFNFEEAIIGCCQRMLQKYTTYHCHLYKKMARSFDSLETYNLMNLKHPWKKSSSNLVIALKYQYWCIYYWINLHILGCWNWKVIWCQYSKTTRKLRTWHLINNTKVPYFWNFQKLIAPMTLKRLIIIYWNRL